MNENYKRLTILAFSGALLMSACGDNAPQSSKVEVVTANSAQKYEGKIVRQPPSNRGKDDGWYLVKNGKRSWIIDSDWLKKNGFDLSAVIEISAAEFAAIPEDPEPTR